MKRALICCIGTLLLTTSVLLGQQTAPDTGRVVNGQLVSDTFEIHHTWEGDTLVLSIRSDLPDNASLMVRVDRIYWEIGSSDTYPIPYLSERSRVGAWEDRTHRVVINDQSWRDSLETRQREFAKIGIGFQLDRIADSVRVDFTVPINQDDPRFGARNSNLVGAVVRDSGLRIIEGELALHKPLGDRPEPAPWVSPDELEVGVTYILTKGAPLMPSFEPEDPLAAIAAARELPAETAVTVRAIRRKRGTPWYQVRVVSSSGEDLTEGWINSVALIGQDIRRRDL